MSILFHFFICSHCSSTKYSLEIAHNRLEIKDKKNLVLSKYLQKPGSIGFAQEQLIR